ncbi:MAG: NAD(P)-binding domain-containing protein [Rickettsiales bacterium]|nr:NAD(P)-binding domain-containing protein [Rickettsiales bacterium]
MNSEKVAVIGAGHIGRLLTRHLVERGYNVIIFNRPNSSNENLIRHEIGALKEQADRNKVWGSVTLTFDLQEVVGCAVINYVAGAPRGKNEERSALFHKNADIAKSYVLTLAKQNPNAIIVNAANPLDLLTRSMHESVIEAGLGNMVLGMGSSLDTKRLHDIIREAANAPNAAVENAYMLGEHGPSMVAVLSQATINGRPLYEVFSEEEIQDITARTRDRGRQIIIETEHSDVAGPAERLLEITEVMLHGKDAFIPCCLPQNDGVFKGHMGYFCQGKVKRFKIEMTDKEEQAVDESCARLQQEWDAFNQ